MPQTLPKAEDLVPQEVTTPKAEDLVPDDDTMSDFFSHLGKQVNPANILKTSSYPAVSAALGESKSLPEQDIPERIGNSLKSAYEAASKGDYATALRHVVLAGSPFESSADLYQQGKPLAATGDMVGAGINLAVPSLLGKAAEGLQGPMGSAAESLYRRALRPTGALEDRASAVQGGLENNLPVNQESVDTLPGLQQKAANATASLMPSGVRIPGSTGRAVQASRDVEAAHSFPYERGDQAAQVANARQQFLDNLNGGVPGGAVRDMTTDEMQNFKTGTYARIRSKAAYEPATPAEEQDAAMAKSFKNDLNQNFPFMAGKLEDEGNLAELAKAMKRTVGTEGNKSILGAGGIGGSVGAGAGTYLGGVPGGIAGALAGGGAGVAIRMAQSPEMLSRIALYLYHGSQGNLSPAMARIQAAGYLNQLAADAADRDKDLQSRNAQQ